MIREIFEKNSSPFYRFGTLINLGKIPEEKFRLFLEYRFTGIVTDPGSLSEAILKISGSHPYYTQQLAFTVWELLNRGTDAADAVEAAASEIVMSHDNDFELLWNTLNRTDMIVLSGMSESEISPISEEFRRVYGTGAPSTVYSTLLRLISKGLIIKEGQGYSIDDPFFRRWILYRRGV